MKFISAGLESSFAANLVKPATCWKGFLVSGGSPTPILGFTDHDRDLLVDGITYEAATGYTATDIATSLDLNTDGLDIKGIPSFPSMTEDDLRAGKWDHARFEIFQVNWADLTQGVFNQRTGHLGEVTLDRGLFIAEFNGLMEAYKTSIGELTSPACRANLGDSRCQVNLTGGSPSFTQTGTIDSVNVDGVTLYDAERTEPGPTGSKTITNITLANPGVVTTSTPHGFTEGQQVTIAGVVGPTALNAATIVLSPNSNIFNLSVDTSSGYPAYISGGTVTAGGNSGFYDNGVITMTSGLNAGHAREVYAYVPGQITLHLPMPYAIVAGDAYSMHAGCDKSITTCKTRFNNILNFRGEPFIGGIDKLVQQGRRQ